MIDEQKKNNRLGERKVSNEGFVMEIIKYKNSHNIVVKFLDEYGATRNTNYCSFSKGEVSNPNKNLHKIGEVNKNNLGSVMKIVEYIDAHNVIVEFQDEHKSRVHTNYDNFLRGSVRNPYFKNICGVACVGKAKTKINGIDTKAYSVWNSMIHRCYDEKYLKNKPTYVDKFVCDEWLCFETFEKWFNLNYYEIENENMQLDKDILIKNNKIYSPNTCVFVPSCINILFAKSRKDDKILGVQKANSGRYVSLHGDGHGGNVYLGTFDTETEAFNAYKTAKEDYIKEVANEYKNKIPQKLYDAMVNYKVEIGD